MTWFEDLTGFREVFPDYVRNHIIVDRHKWTSRVNK